MAIKPRIIGLVSNQPLSRQPVCSPIVEGGPLCYEVCMTPVLCKDMASLSAYATLPCDLDLLTIDPQTGSHGQD